MNTNVPSSVDVAIVGAGPAGLTLACALRQSRINVIVLDAAPEPSSYSRATLIHSGTLEVLDDIGVTPEILREGLPISAFNAWSRTSYLTKLEFSQMQAKYQMSIGLPQSNTERILASRLHELKGETIRGATVTGMSECGGTVELEVTGSAGTTTTVSAGYVVAADGLHSALRKMLQIPFKGIDYRASMLAADCRLSTSGKFRLSPDEASICFGADGFVLFLPMSTTTWRVQAPLEDAPKHATLEQVQKLIEERAPPGVIVEDVTWSNRFQIHHRHAKHYRKGHVFLLGDAAHILSPAGGQGMNTGIQDAIELAAVLKAAIVDGEDTESDLDQYEDIRRPVAKEVMAMTHRLTMVGQWKSAWARCARNWFIGLFMQISGVQPKVTRRFAAFDYAQ
ncbi:hypothetical protein LTR36_002755 [Oleoguttula mirabilis]|uniref:FAD-binding domain-containing protein n=1 Tax=Oleoguttula mirabilis TaxID=1507867 RepID=A0AAV9JJK1_9PEZI|nr:hypothetical protein LTR36_002755 [Oleoguttula mirabilis]